MQRRKEVAGIRMKTQTRTRGEGGVRGRVDGSGKEVGVVDARQAAEAGGGMYEGRVLGEGQVEGMVRGRQ